MARLMDILLCRWIRPHHFLVLLALMGFLAIGAAYAIAVLTRDVRALLPYISDTGTYPPESCVFGFFLSIASFLAFVCMFIRHEQFADQIFLESRLPHFLNDVAMLFGFLCALGICMVASFQETNLSIMHFVGSCLVFGCGVIYCWIHSYLSYKSVAYGMTGLCIAWFRFALSFFATCFFAFFFIGMSEADSHWSNGKHSNDTQLRWKERDSGYVWHLTSTFSEWLMVFFFIFFFLTFFPEFKKIRIISRVHQHYNCETPRSDILYGGEIIT